MEYILLSEKDWDDVFRLMKESFLPREPTCLALHIAPESVMNMFTMIADLGLKSGISYGARDTDTGKLAGFMLCRISLLKDQEMEKSFKWEGTPEEHLFVEVNEDAYKNIDLFSSNKVESILEFMTLTVDPSYKGKGIARKLVELSEAKGIELGCQLGKVEASNVITQYIWKKLGYEIFKMFDFQEYNKDKGKEVFDVKAVAPSKGWHCMSKKYDTIDYSLLSEKDFDDVKLLLINSFLAREPTVLALHMKPEELMNLFDMLLDMTLKSGVSYGARDTGTGELVGFMLNKISELKDQEMEKSFQWEGTPQETLYIEIFKNVYKDIDLFAQNGVEKIFDFCCLTVDPSYKGKGIARKLVQKSEAKGIEKGCQLGKVEASNIITQNLWKKLDYQIFTTLDFQEYNKEKGKEVFDPKAAAPTMGWHCMSKKLIVEKIVKESSGIIEYTLLSEKDWDDVVPLMKDSFLAREPTCLALHIKPETVMNLFTVILDMMLKSGASFGARDTGSGKLVGFMLNLIETLETQEMEKNFKWDGTPEENLFSEISKEVYKDIDLFAQHSVERIFHFMCLTVDPSCKGKGIAGKLVELSEAKGIEVGCQLGKVEASNVITQHIWKKLGYENFTTLDFHKYNEEKGKEMFDLKAAAPTSGWYCMSKRLDGK